MALRSTLKNWFLTRKKPTQDQYATLIDSCFNLDEDSLPIGKVDGLQNTLNEMQLSLQNNTGGAGSFSETYLAVNGDFAKTFNAGQDLDSILIDPPGTGLFQVQIGTTQGGNDIGADVPIDGDDPEPFIRRKYFKTSGTWYFTNIPINTTVKFFYK